MNFYPSSHHCHKHNNMKLGQLIDTCKQANTTWALAKLCQDILERSVQSFLDTIRHSENYHLDQSTDNDFISSVEKYQQRLAQLMCYEGRDHEREWGFPEDARNYKTYRNSLTYCVRDKLNLALGIQKPWYEYGPVSETEWFRMVSVGLTQYFLLSATGVPGYLIQIRPDEPWCDALNMFLEDFLEVVLTDAQSSLVRRNYGKKSKGPKMYTQLLKNRLKKRTKAVCVKELVQKCYRPLIRGVFSRKRIDRYRSVLPQYQDLLIIYHTFEKQVNTILELSKLPTDMVWEIQRSSGPGEFHFSNKVAFQSMLRGKKSLKRGLKIKGLYDFETFQQSNAVVLKHFRLLGNYPLDQPITNIPVVGKRVPIQFLLVVMIVGKDKQDYLVLKDKARKFEQSYLSRSLKVEKFTPDREKNRWGAVTYKETFEKLKAIFPTYLEYYFSSMPWYEWNIRLPNILNTIRKDTPASRWSLRIRVKDFVRVATNGMSDYPLRVSWHDKIAHLRYREGDSNLTELYDRLFQMKDRGQTFPQHIWIALSIVSLFFANDLPAAKSEQECRQNFETMKDTIAYMLSNFEPSGV